MHQQFSQIFSKLLGIKSTAQWKTLPVIQIPIEVPFIWRFRLKREQDPYSRSQAVPLFIFSPSRFSLPFQPLQDYSSPLLSGSVHRSPRTDSPQVLQMKQPAFIGRSFTPSQVFQHLHQFSVDLDQINYTIQRRKIPFKCFQPEPNPSSRCYTTASRSRPLPEEQYPQCFISDIINMEHTSTLKTSLDAYRRQLSNACSSDTMRKELSSVWSFPVDWPHDPWTHICLRNILVTHSTQHRAVAWSIEETLFTQSRPREEYEDSRRYALPKFCIHAYYQKNYYKQP